MILLQKVVSTIIDKQQNTSSEVVLTTNFLENLWLEPRCKTF
jgi:hypothetical protein